MTFPFRPSDSIVLGHLPENFDPAILITAGVYTQTKGVKLLSNPSRFQARGWNHQGPAVGDHRFTLLRLRLKAKAFKSSGFGREIPTHAHRLSTISGKVGTRPPTDGHFIGKPYCLPPLLLIPPRQSRDRRSCNRSDNPFPGTIGKAKDKDPLLFTIFPSESRSRTWTLTRASRTGYLQQRSSTVNVHLHHSAPASTWHCERDSNVDSS